MQSGDAILALQKPVDYSLARDLRVAARDGAAGERKRGRRRGAMTQRDENPAGVHLPLDPLPGHSSRGRLERVLRRGEFAVTAELNPPDSADPEDVYDRVAPFDGWVDAINAVDASGANCHMSSRRHLRASDPHGLCAGAAGRLPRPQPHRHPGRCAGRGRDGRRQRPLPDRRRRAGRRPAGRHSRSSTSIRSRCWKPCAPCATRRASSPAERSPRRRISSSAQPPIRSRRPTSSAPLRLAKKVAGRGAVRADAVLLRRAAVPRTSCAGCAISGCTKNASSWSASARSPRPRRRAGSAPTCRASTSPTRSSRGSKGAQNQKQEGKNICIEIMQECREIAGRLRRPCHGLPAGGAGRRDRARIRACSPAAGRGGARRARTTRASRERLQDDAWPKQQADEPRTATSAFRSLEH